MSNSTKFDPKHTSLTGLEVVALVLPLVFAPIFGAAAYALIAWMKRGNGSVSDTFGWLSFVLIVASVIAGIKIGETLSHRMLKGSQLDE